MVWPEDIASELPEPHPEEPAQLRSDILDELSDHLQSSLEHEQLTEADADAAKNSVLSRFGNPATIACRLWWDAMWGRIMLQRITLVFVALLCCVSIVMTFIVWSAIDQSQQATAALVAQVQKLADREIVVTFPEDHTEPDERFKYLEWIPVKVKLKDEAGQPITDPEFSVTLHGMKLLNDSNNPNVLEEHPDENGVVDFGLVRPVVGTFTFAAPGNATMTLKEYQFRPGIPTELEITCPQEVFHMVDAKVSINWPEDLKQKNLWTYARMSANPREISGHEWNTAVTTTAWFLIGPDGSIYKTSLQHDPKLESGFPVSAAYELGYLEYFLTGKISYENQVVPSAFNAARKYGTAPPEERLKARYEESLKGSKYLHASMLHKDGLCGKERYANQRSAHHAETPDR